MIASPIVNLFHVAYFDSRGALLRQRALDPAVLAADPAGAQLIGVFAQRLSKPTGAHTLGFSGQFAAELSVQWHLSIESCATVQFFAAGRPICTSLLLSGRQAQVDRMALDAYWETLWNLVRSQGGPNVAPAMKNLNQRPLVVSVLWDTALDEPYRLALGAAEGCFAAAFFALPAPPSANAAPARS